MAARRKPVEEPEHVLKRVTLDSSWFEVGLEGRRQAAEQTLGLVATYASHTIAVCEALTRMLSKGTKNEQLTSLTVANRSFSTRAEMRKYCRDLLNASEEGMRICTEDASFLHGILEHHPRGPEKASGVKAFTKGRIDGNGDGNPCFVLIRSSGQEEDFSYQRCVLNVPTEEARTQESICNCLISILQLHPNVGEPVARMISEKFPFIRGKNVVCEKHWNWVRSLLHIASNLPALTEFLLVTLIRRMLEIDSDIHRLEETGKLDEDMTVMVDILDIMMLRHFEFLQRRLDSGGPSGNQVAPVENQLVQTMMGIFEGQVLMTHQCRHVQFLYFYIASLRPAWSERFLTQLLQTAYSGTTPLHKRLITMAYLASFVARAKFLTTKYSLRTAQYLSAFAREHQEAAERCVASGDLAHPQLVLFLASVQAVCYILCWHLDAFREEVLESGLTGLSVLLPFNSAGAGSEAFSPVLDSSCRPLGMISSTIAKQFLKVLKVHYPAVAGSLRTQLSPNLHRGGTHLRACMASGGYGGSGADGVARVDDGQVSGLDSFFPFDPYRLYHSEIFMKREYRLYDPGKGCDSDADASDASVGFRGDEDPKSRIRANSQMALEDSDQSDADVVDSAGAVERGFVPSIGPSPAFRPLRTDTNIMDAVSPLVLEMECADDGSDFLLPAPSMEVHGGNQMLAQYLQTPAYNLGR